MINVSIFGASGYAGGELLRILSAHPKVKIQQATSRQFAGLPVSLVNPNLRKKTDLIFSHPDQLKKCNLLFVALPNGESMKYMDKFKTIAEKIIDLGADYRLREQTDFEHWYKQEHKNPKMLKRFVYGLAELHREEIKKSSYIAGAGCEATVSIL